MGESGILHEDDRVELLDGEIIDMSPIGVKHANCVRRLNNLFSQKAGGKAIVDVQNPLRLDEHSEPQPDILLLKPKQDFYASSLPCAEDVLLLIEVMDTSASYDRQIKLPLYARHGVQEVWLVSLLDENVEVYRNPVSGAYQEKQILNRGKSVSPQSFPDFLVAVSDILG